MSTAPADLFGEGAFARDMAAQPGRANFSETSGPRLVPEPGIDTPRRAEEIIRQVSDLLDELVAMNFGELPASDRVRFTSDLGVQASRLGALRDVAVASLAKDQAWEGSGSRNITDHVRSTSKSSSREASKIVERAKVLDEELPLFRSAFTAGQIDEEKIEIVSRYTTDSVLKEKLGDPVEGEAYLLRLAKAKNSDVFRKQVRAWAMKAAPKVAEDNHKKAVRQERITLVPDDDGYVVRGWLTSLNGEIVNVALKAMMGVPTREDPRLPTERRAGALVELARQFLDEGNANRAATVRPHISVHVPFEVLDKIAPESGLAAEELPACDASGSDRACGCESPAGVGTGSPAGYELGAPPGKEPGAPPSYQLGAPPGYESGAPPGYGPGAPPAKGGGKLGSCIHDVRRERKRAGELLAVIRAGIDEDLLTGSPPATLDDGTPINYSELQTLLCTGDLHRVLLSSDGEVLDVGRKYRIATTPQAKAVIARDRTCRYPGCDRTIGSSEIHHSQYWESGGETNIDNLVMLCWHHHKHVHQEAITITHHRDGWVFTSPQGYVGTTPHGL